MFELYAMLRAAQANDDWRVARLITSHWTNEHWHDYEDWLETASSSPLGYN